MCGYLGRRFICSTWFKGTHIYAQSPDINNYYRTATNLRCPAVHNFTTVSVENATPAFQTLIAFLHRNVYEQMMFQAVQLWNQATQSGHQIFLYWVAIHRSVPGNKTATSVINLPIVYSCTIHTFVYARYQIGRTAYCQESLGCSLGKSRLIP